MLSPLPSNQFIYFCLSTHPHTGVRTWLFFIIPFICGLAVISLVQVMIDDQLLVLGGKWRGFTSTKLVYAKAVDRDDASVVNHPALNTTPLCI